MSGINHHRIFCLTQRTFFPSGIDLVTMQQIVYDIVKVDKLPPVEEFSLPSKGAHKYLCGHKEL
jgi:hypothetical protein